MDMSTLFATLPLLPCQCYTTEELGRGEAVCVCDHSEQAVRAYAAGVQPLPALTAQQRTLCVEEILYCQEGVRAVTYDHTTDQEIARDLLAAWRWYCRDKGLL